MLPRRPAKVRSGRSHASWARRRTEPVPMRAPGRQGVEPLADQGVAGVGPLGHGGDRQALGRRRRQVLGRVDGEVGPAVEHRGLHLLHEHAPAAQLPDGDVGPPVAHRVDHDRLNLNPEEPSDQVGLGPASLLPRVAAREH